MFLKDNVNFIFVTFQEPHVRGVRSDVGGHGRDELGAGGMSGPGLGVGVRLLDQGRQELGKGGLLHRSLPLRCPLHSLH